MTEQTVTLLYVAAAIATVAVLALELRTALRRIWNNTVGARQNQRRLINRLFPGANLEYVDAVLGPATLISRSRVGGTIRRYRLLDCWVSVGEEDGAAEWVSVTITDPKFVFRTKRLTNGLIDIRLGRDCFDRSGYRPASKYANIGQKEQSYVEVEDGSTHHRSQKAILGYTNAGVGELSTHGELPASAVVRCEKTTINTYAIARPFGELPPEAVLGWQEVQAVPLGRRRVLTTLLRRLRLRWQLKRGLGVIDLIRRRRAGVNEQPRSSAVSSRRTGTTQEL